MKKMLLLLAIVILGIGGCGQVDLSGFHDLAGTVQSVHPDPAPSSASLSSSCRTASASVRITRRANSRSTPASIPARSQEQDILPAGIRQLQPPQADASRRFTFWFTLATTMRDVPRSTSGQVVLNSCPPRESTSQRRRRHAAQARPLRAPTSPSGSVGCIGMVEQGRDGIRGPGRPTVAQR